MSLVKSKAISTALVGLGIFAALQVTAGCNQSGGGASTNSSASGSTASDTDLTVAGKTVYDSNGCQRCHALNGQGGRMGPDLSHVGADSSHTPQVIADYVKNPKAKNPSSRMPGFEGKISDKDLLALGTYLASLK